MQNQTIADYLTVGDYCIIHRVTYDHGKQSTRPVYGWATALRADTLTVSDQNQGAWWAETIPNSRVRAISRYNLYEDQWETAHWDEKKGELHVERGTTHFH